MNLMITEPLKNFLESLFPKSNVVNNLTTTEEGYALDARQGRILQDMIGSQGSSMSSELNKNIKDLEDKMNSSSKTLDDKINSTTKSLEDKISEQGKKYLPLTGGTMSGNITVKRSDAGSNLTVNYNDQHSLSLTSATSGNAGLYDNTYGKYLIYADSSGNTTLSGSIYVKNNLYLGDVSTTGTQRQVRFQVDKGTYTHNTYLYGGNSDSTTAIGVYDSKNARTVFAYNDTNNVVNFVSTLNSGGKTVSVDGHTHSYLPLSGGTITNGNLVVTRTSSSEGATLMRVSNSKGDCSMSIEATTAGNIGLWNDNMSEWVIRCNSAENVYVGNSVSDTFICDLSGVWRPAVVTVATDGKQICYLSANTRTQLLISGQWSTNEVWSNATVTVSTSDIRLKENIKPTQVVALDLINKIQMYEFDWKDDNRHQSLGFIADYLEEIDPNFVFGGGYDENGNINYKGVDDFYLDGYLVKAVQELSEENYNLKSIVHNQQDEINELKDEISNMKLKFKELENKISSIM